MEQIIVTAQEYQATLIEKTKQVTTSEKNVKKLTQLQHDMVNAMERKQQSTRSSRKRRAEELEDCNGCRNPRFGCDQCKLVDISKRLKLAEEVHQSNIEELEFFAQNTRVAPVPEPVNVNEENVNGEVKSENATPPIVIIPLHQPKSEPQSSEEDAIEATDTEDSTTSNSTDENDANTSYDQIVQRNLAQETDSSNDDNALETSFDMWMPSIESSDADETADADANNADADNANGMPNGICYCCDNLDFCLNEF